MNQIWFNPHATGAHPAAALYSRDSAAQLRALFAHLPGFAPTRLVPLAKLAEAFKLGAIYAKDERARLNQGSFKALGGAYAVVRLVADARRFKPADILEGNAPPTTTMTFATATAGNHGRAVAFGARLCGARAVIFIYGDVPQAHRDAIAGLGAQLVAVPGDYEAACRAAQETSAENGWILVSDVAAEGYTGIPALIMQGYSVLAAEALEQMPRPPTHVIVQAGVGGLATPTASYFTNNVSPKPKIIVVEAATVPCLMESARANAMTRTPPTGTTNLSRLDCPTPSTTTWPVLRALASAFVGVGNGTADEAATMMRDVGLPTTPTGATGLAGLIALSREVGAFERLGLDADARVLIVLTEQAA